jgi:hypothetical protein
MKIPLGALFVIAFATLAGPVKSADNSLCPGSLHSRSPL